jgi:hypothetical protein
MGTLKKDADRRCASGVLIALGSDKMSSSDLKVVELFEPEVVFLRQHLKEFLHKKETP